MSRGNDGQVAASSLPGAAAGGASSSSGDRSGLGLGGFPGSALQGFEKQIVRNLGGTAADAWGGGDDAGKCPEVRAQLFARGASDVPLAESLGGSSREAAEMAGTGAGDSSGRDAGSDDDSEVFVGFARVFSGVLRPNRPVFVLGPKYDPARAYRQGGQHVSQTWAPLGLYMMMGRELSALRCVPAGCVAAISGLEGHVLKAATVCSTPACLPLSPMAFQTIPLVQVSVEPGDVADLPKLRRGLQLLNQSDPCVEVSVDSSERFGLQLLRCSLPNAGEPTVVDCFRCAHFLGSATDSCELHHMVPYVPTHLNLLSLRRRCIARGCPRGAAPAAVPQGTRAKVR